MSTASASPLRTRRPWTRCSGSSRAGYDYGGDVGGWPEASAQADPGGVYFIYYGGVVGRALLGQLAVALVDGYGAVTVEEL